MYEGKYCKIINRFTGKIIASGKIINHKDNPIICITFDNRYFFNLKKHLFYKVIFCDNCENIPFDNIKYKNKIKMWKENDKNKYSLVYRDFDIYELDKEIADLVYILNNLYLRTTGSCCGHGNYPAWIDINFISFSQIKKLLEILSKEKFCKKFILTSQIKIISNGNGIILQLKTVNIGKKAYKDINFLVKYLNELYKINDTFFIDK